MAKKKKKKKDCFYRAVKHSLTYANKRKKANLFAFLSDYQIAIQESINFIWNNKIITDGYTLDIQNNIFSSPMFIDYKLITYSVSLSARALRSACDQALGIVLGVVYKKACLFYGLRKATEENNLKAVEYITKKLNKLTISKPIVNENTKAELDSNCVDLQIGRTSFDCFVRLKSLGKTYGHIKLPIKFNKVDKKWASKGQLISSILLSKDTVELRYKVSKPALKTVGITVGADTGVKSVITLSDGQTPPTTNKTGHSLDSVLTIMSRKKVGSKAFKKSEDHRKNIINWSLNQLNLINIAHVKLEHISNLFFGKNTSRKLKRFTNSAIESKAERLFEETGVLLTLEDSVYKSQRCFGCTVVRKANRKGKIYLCSCCGYTEDADLNAAKNNEISLPIIPNWLKKKGYNTKGFFWKEDGFYNLEGQELISP